MYTPNQDRYNKMTYRKCGASGLKLPAVSVGLWHNFGTNDNYETMRQVLTTAFDCGVCHFDAANNYGPVPGSAEENLGKILRQDFQAYRDELVISTKAGYDMWPGPYGDRGSRKYILASLDQSLGRMGLDYVDIFYHHRPDPDTPIEESMGALATAVASGKALYAGISNYNREQTEKAAAVLRDLKCPFILNQVRYSMLDRHIEEDGLVDYAGESGLGLIIYSPLEQGLLSGRYLGGIPADSRMGRGVRFLKPERLTTEMLAKIKELNEVAAARGQTLAQMALSWVLKRSEITSVIIGASRPQQVSENVFAAQKSDFTAEELAKIDAVCK